MTVLPVQLALRLADAGLGFVVVGSTARWLRGSSRAPHDLDVVVAPSDLAALVRALAPVALGGPPWRRAVDRRADTTYGPVDVFFRPPRGRSGSLDVEGRCLEVAGG